LNETVYFLSDTHFKYRAGDVNEKGKRERFKAFIRGIQGARRLYLVGDIFDFWFEYRSVIPRYYHDILESLNGLRNGGTRIFITGGNHDFWLGDFLAEAAGITVLPSLSVHELQGRKVAVTHGDMFLPGDYGYKMLKTLIRSRPARAIAGAIHPDILFGLAGLFSKTSKGITHGKTSRYARAVTELAPDSFFRWGNDVFVMGHVHMPVIKDFGGRIFSILGDWEEHNSYLRLENGSFALERYKPEVNTFIEKR